METQHYYQAQYQPSFERDQAKIDEFGIDSLNTPDINPEFFTDANLFAKANNAFSMGKSSSVNIKLDDEYGIFSELGMNGGSTVNASAYDRTTYSPYAIEDTKQHQLDSATININSPEMMMPVSPNKVCPSLGYDDLIGTEQSTFNQMSDYETMANFDTYAHHSSPSTSGSNSRSSSISAGSDNYLSEYILSDPSAHLMTTSSTSSLDTLMCRVPQSPAGSITSVYSTESSPSQATPKTFTQLETLQHPIVIKQEPVDLYQPTVLEEYENYQMQPLLSQQQQQQQQMVAPVSSYSTINTNDFYTYSTTALPSTVTSAVMQPPMVTPTTASSSHSRKRNAASAFSSSSSSSSSGTAHQQTSSGSSTKKPRMTKREKQKLMEGDISRYETENHDLRNSIDMLERQIQFCKRFLSDNVAPVIQRQQQQMHFAPSAQAQQHQQMLITVEGM